MFYAETSDKPLPQHTMFQTLDIGTLTFRKSDSGFIRVDGVQNPFVANLSLGNKADFATDIRYAPTHFYQMTEMANEKKDGGRFCTATLPFSQTISLIWRLVGFAE